MKKYLPIIIVLFFLTIKSCTSQKFKQNIEIDKSLNSFNRKVDSIVANKMNTYNIPGLSIGIIVNDSIVYTKGYGIKNINTKHIVNSNSNFHTASISKLFTAQAIIILVQKNKISLNNKLVEIIPELKYKDERVKNITIKSLLNHTSGLTDVNNYHWKNNNKSDNSLSDYILGLNLKLRSEPHKEYNYSNLGYNILGYVIEKLSETNFDEFIKENILIPSQMSSSDFRYFKIADSLKTSPHSKRFITKRIYKSKTYPYTREQAPSSTLNSSSNDLSKWMISFLKPIDSLNLKNSFQQMLEPSFSSYPYIGLGFQLNNLFNKQTIGHFGGDKGYKSYLIMVPKEKIGLVLLANCDYDEDFRQEILHPILKIMLKNKKLQIN
ncbi:beta-lactamase family protein [Polaribacter haliotis]|uniref:Beta-lactamase family protein n=1 Tax=Polaribacter haliotis TaxID=1888915 RepID=A0A7L8AI29_9FLAO|nr:serine hydrolase domain-containing protein [Polaribacter haliotis]QOD61660.1 beta-lactamase family protein [Polaribacter haliotis]